MPQGSFFKHPKVPYQGSIIKGYAEIEKNTYPYVIDFIISFSMYVSSKARLNFLDTKEKKGIEFFREYAEENFLDTRKMTRRVRSLLPSEGYNVDPYMGFLFSFEHNGVKTLKEFQKIYAPVTADVRISVTKQQHKSILDVEDLSDFIIQMLGILDNMFFDIQRESDHQLIFVPRILSKTDKIKRAEMLDNQMWELNEV